MLVVVYIRLVILFNIFVNSSFKITSFTDAARTTGSTSKFIY